MIVSFTLEEFEVIVRNYLLYFICKVFCFKIYFFTLNTIKNSEFKFFANFTLINYSFILLQIHQKTFLIFPDLFNIQFDFCLTETKSKLMALIIAEELCHIRTHFYQLFFALMLITKEKLRV